MFKFIFKPMARLALGLLGLALLTCLAVLLTPATPAHAESTRTIEVDALDDGDVDQGCTLREAIDLSNAAAPAGPQPNGCEVVHQVGQAPFPIVYVIEVPPLTYTLTGAAGEDFNQSGDLDVRAPVTIHGAGQEATRISGGGHDRVFHLNPGSAGGVALQIRGVTIQEGVSNSGAGLYVVEASLTLIESTVYDNRAASSGGGIYVEAEGVPQVEVEANGVAASLTLTRTTILSNSAGYGGGGLGLDEYWAEVTAHVSATHILSNTALNGGGVFLNAYGDGRATLTIDRSTLAGNEAGEQGGGAFLSSELYSLSQATLANSTLDRNRAGAGAAGLRAYSDGFGSLDLGLEGCTLSRNTSDGAGGGLVVYSGPHGSSSARLHNCTVSGNQAAGSGGGLYTGYQAGLQLLHVTVTDNTVYPDEDQECLGGGLRSGVDAWVTLANSIVAGNHLASGSGDEDCTVDLSGHLTSEGYNVVGEGTGCPSDGAGDRTTIDPRLGPLTHNAPSTGSAVASLYAGPATETQALLAGSPALDLVPVLTCTLPVDQRGVDRPQGPRCESGAYEAEPALSLFKRVEPETGLALLELVTYTLVLTNAGSAAESTLLTDSLPAEVHFGHWLAGGRPPDTLQVGDRITWTGTVTAGQPITFAFVATVTAETCALVTNRASYRHASGAGSAQATFACEAVYPVYLPLVLRSRP